MAKQEITIFLETHLNAEERDSAIGAVKKISGVFNVAAVFPGEQDPVLGRLYTAEVDVNAAARTMVDIRKVEGVEMVQLPAPRRAI